MEKDFYGECQCRTCGKPAYYQVGGVPVCGRHKAGSSMKLPRNPDAKANFEKLLETHRSDIERAASQRRHAGQPGSVRLMKMKMFRRNGDLLVKGHLSVFPNNRHQHLKEGFGCASLSPMRMGPVYHGQPGLPPATSIENFHQGSKWFAGRTKEEFREMQRKMFLDPEPQRHNPHAIKDKSGNKNIPKCFVWTDKEGSDHELTYLQSRQFYCTFYQRFAEASEDFKKLKSHLERGVDLCICGYDARNGTVDPDKEYLDDSKPFGHELVLYTMLTVTDTQDYPWVKHKNPAFEF